MTAIPDEAVKVLAMDWCKLSISNDTQLRPLSNLSQNFGADWHATQRTLERSVQSPPETCGAALQRNAAVYL